MSFAQRPLDDWRPPAPQDAKADAAVAPHSSPDTEATIPAAVASPAATKTTADVWGWLPVLSIVQAGGLLLISFANVGALANNTLSNLFFWMGLAVMLIPTAMRLIATNAARQERIGLVITLGLGLYLVKLIQSPFAFTYSDEFLHLFNTNQILQNQALFTPNAVLPVSPLFPGLPSVTAAIATLTGLSVFHAGAILIGVARLLLVTAIFLFAEQITRSARIAGLAALIFMCNSNFLYWSAQFAYESLSLPLVIGTFYLIARRERAGRRSTYMAYTILALLSVSAIVVTHHLSSYFMVAFLFGWLVLVRTNVHLALGKSLHIVNRWRKGVLDTDEMVEAFRSQSTHPTSAANATDGADAETSNAEPGNTERGPEGLALFSFILALAWLTYVAISTYGYLSLLLSRAGLSLLDVLTGSAEVRQLFAGDDGYVAPLAERIITLTGVALSLLGLPFGLQHFWQKYRHSAVTWILATGAVSYFAMLPLRLTNASWETGNRASVYFYLGLAFILALAADKLWPAQEGKRIGFGLGFAFAVAFVTIFAGGVVAGWQPQLRFTQPLVVDADSEAVVAAGISAAQWMHNTIGPNQQIISDEANGRLLLAYGEQTGYIGRHPYVRDILSTPTLTPQQLGVMQEWDLDYAVVDRREVAWDNMAGYFFDGVDAQGESTAEWVDQRVYEKFDRQPLVSRVMDAGSLVVYDVADLVTTARRMANGEALTPEEMQLLLPRNEQGPIETVP